MEIDALIPIVILLNPPPQISTHSYKSTKTDKNVVAGCGWNERNLKKWCGK